MYFCESAKALSKRRRIHYKFNISFSITCRRFLDFRINYSENSKLWAKRQGWIYYCFASFGNHSISIFSVEINFSVRNREFELISTLKNCFLTYALFGVMLILTKNPIIDSRYLFLSSFAFYIAFSLLGRYVFKHYMIKKISKSKFAQE